ncbi:hypothetical protein [Aquimarina aquimarini]|uniref:hypothetical protein n=1 Tax=Aquimarina aquimarini TaxID=1191734 RepID=UPI001F37179E|nr:hypothetical protein [Aquimarina aquimarini]
MKYIKKIIVFVILLEVINLVVGVFYNGKDAFLSITGFNAPPLYYDMDSLYGVTRQKNTKQIIQYPWGGVVNQINSYGFRDDEFTNEGTLVVGNSFVEGYGMNNEDRFSEKIEKELNTVIHNAGSGGVWTPIQGVVLLEHLVRAEKLDFDKIIFVMTPAEIINIGKRNPKNDSGRSYPYKKGEEIKFHKAKNNNFGDSLSLPNKVKRFCKSLLMFKVYNMFKYYGAAKVKAKTLEFDKYKLDWLFKKIEEQELNQVIDVVVINNLRRTKLATIEEYNIDSEAIRFHVLQFPDELSNYFVSNGHLNEKGNTVLAELLQSVFK